MPCLRSTLTSLPPQIQGDFHQQAPSNLNGSARSSKKANGEQDRRQHAGARSCPDQSRLLLAGCSSELQGPWFRALPR
ncbi:hypothetical protein SLEP1_g13553 [Rubroshorea leprosula]|uniref:Uncharacterized protein n=1 Tax=Rubroshorea leprosula TaxID=152421 RepID=A0AAV5IQ64_9ROSI|nr:hypothetical protein SLEP1_g13553 [Rubroshorea leprosula]